ncbi:ACP S-malonyltransferase [Allorhizobium taibaishanense]|uniref:[acyl-carrier-protein] S-malonyltransferase n=1 Tax=Allorhizobium taibaishanense TaxID=887144 RepID=A0A1Q9A6W2_9HYPH|nr:acyltransferase domain-containing protein [Allorhizobium taibaishanense]MBB4008524.1 [acyl-carrier-protein] S-malonyltransferase [Allorhizobium taibaishanense]OLP50319.1 hypothetical protein BJF91_13490 [Allorhizobium taibaishanense]
MSFALLCPGQSAQSADMLERLRGNDAAEAIFSAFYQVVGTHLHDVMSDPGRLYDNAVAQPILCAVEMAAFAALRERLAQPLAIAGYSIGELAAYGCAGAISPADVIRLARQRAEAMDQASSEEGGMLAVRGLREQVLTPLCDTFDASVAIRNGPDRFVVATSAANLERLAPALERAGAHTTRLSVKIASHSPLMASAVPVFRRALQQVTFQDPPIPVLAGIDGGFVRSRERAIEVLSAQLAQTVDWAACLAGLREGGCSATLELLPGKDLTAMAQAELPEFACRAMAEFRSLDGVVTWVSRHCEPL